MDTPSIFKLSAAEKLQLVEDLWDDLASTPEEVPVHDWQRREIDRRLEALAADPSAVLSWDQVVATIRRKHGR